MLEKIKNILFPFYKSKEVSKIFNILESGDEKNKVAMFVGGCVRKFILNEKIDDIDIATVFSPEQLKLKFKDTDIKIIDSGIEHGTLTLISNDVKFELTTLRIDTNPDGRHTEISFTDNWTADSERRDFTINSIYLDRKGKIFDPQMGLEDLRNRVIKFIGDPSKRIEEDYLRIIRFIRFSIQYDYSKYEKSTIQAIKLNLNGIQKISKERILQEIIKILKLDNFKNIASNKELQNIFLIIFPEFKYLTRIERLEILSKKKLYMNNVEFLLAILLVDKSNNYEYFMHRYKLSNSMKNRINLFAKNYIEFTSNKNFFKKNINKNIYSHGKNIIKEFLFFSFLENKKMKEEELDSILADIGKAKIPKFPFDGNYLKKRGFSEGQNIGHILKDLEQEWVRNNYYLTEKNINIIINKFK